ANAFRNVTLCVQLPCSDETPKRPDVHMLRTPIGKWCSFSTLLQRCNGDYGVILAPATLCRPRFCATQIISTVAGRYNDKRSARTFTLFDKLNLCWKAHT